MAGMGFIDFVKEPAHRSPDRRLAVVHGDRCLTFSEVDRRADQLAGWLDVLPRRQEESFPVVGVRVCRWPLFEVVFVDAEDRKYLVCVYADTVGEHQVCEAVAVDENDTCAY